MKLHQYLTTNEISRATFAKRLGCASESVRRYIAGERIPDKEKMLKIVHLTGGQVQPNDFYLNNPYQGSYTKTVPLASEAG